jgi:hypothetical protein
MHRPASVSVPICPSSHSISRMIRPEPGHLPKGLNRLGVLHQTTLPYSPYMNGQNRDAVGAGGGPASGHAGERA